MMKRFFSENRMAFMEGGAPGGSAESAKPESVAPMSTPMTAPVSAPVLPPVMLPTAEQNAVNPAISTNSALPATPEGAMPAAAPSMPTAANAIPKTPSLQNLPGAPETAPGMPQMGQNPEVLKPVTAEDAKKATTAALEKGQRIGKSGMTKIETLAGIQVEQFNIPA